MIIKTGQKRGFILLEVLVALVVLASGIAFLMQALSMIARTNREVFGDQLANLETSNLLARYYGGNLAQPQGKDTIMGKEFSWQYTKEPEKDLMSDLQIKVSWQEGAQGKKLLLDQYVLTQN